MESLASIRRICCRDQIPPAREDARRTVHWIGEDSADHYKQDPAVSPYGPDSIVYRLNSLGYRGDEFSEPAEFTIAVFGCEFVFGQGVAESDLFHSILTAAIREKSGKSIRVRNLGTRDGANETILRLASIAVPLLDPDLVIVCFTRPPRREYWRVDGEPYLFDPDRPPSGRIERELKEHLLSLSNPYADTLNFYRNYLAVSRLLEGRQWAFASVDRRIIAHLGELIDFSRYCGPIERIDSARDGVSPGRESHNKFADQIVRLLYERHNASSTPSGKKILSDDDAIWNLVRKQREDHKYAAAERTLRDALASYRDNPRLYFELGGVLEEQELFVEQTGRVSDAIRMLSRAVELAPSESSYRKHLAASLDAQGMLLEAEAEVRKALEGAKADGELYSLLSRILLRQQRPAEALSTARKALNISPRDQNALEVASEGLVMLGQMKQAESGIRQALKLCPDSAVLNFQLAVATCENLLQSDRSKFPDAMMSLLNKAICARPDNGLYRLFHGCMLCHHGRKQDAVWEFVKALELGVDESRCEDESERLCRTEDSRHIAAEAQSEARSITSRRMRRSDALATAAASLHQLRLAYIASKAARAPRLRLLRSLFMYDLLDLHRGGRVIELEPQPGFFLYFCAYLGECSVFGLGNQSAVECADVHRQWGIDISSSRIYAGIPIEVDRQGDVIAAFARNFNEKWRLEENAFLLSDCSKHLADGGKIALHGTYRKQTSALFRAAGVEHRCGSGGSIFVLDAAGWKAKAEREGLFDKPVPRARVRFLLERGAIEEAELVLRSVLRECPDDREIALELARLLLRGDSGEALTLIRSVLSDINVATGTRIKCLSMLIETGSVDEAVEYLDIIEQSARDDLPSLMELYRRLCGKEKYPEAFRCARKAVQLNPKLDAPGFISAENDESYAETLYRLSRALRSLGDFSGAERAASACCKLDSENPRYLLSQCRALFESGKRVACRRKLQALQKKDLSGEIKIACLDLMEQLDAYLYLRLVRSLNNYWRPKETIKHARAVAQLFPYNNSLTVAYATCLRRYSEFSEAEKLLRCALMAVPEDAEINFALADIIACEEESDELCGREGEIRALLCRTVQLRPDVAHYKVKLAEHLGGEDAIALLRAAISQEPRLSRAYAVLGKELYKAGRFIEALTELRNWQQRATEYDSEFSLLYVRCLRRIASLSEAEKALRDEMLVEPQSAAFHFELADILGHLQLSDGVCRAEEKTRLLQRAAELAPDNLEYRTGYAAELLRLGRADEARSQMLRAIKLADGDVNAVRSLFDVEAAVPLENELEAIVGLAPAEGLRKAAVCKMMEAARASVDLDPERVFSKFVLNRRLHISRMLKLFDALNLTPGSKVLDIGAGCGYFSYICKALEQCDVTATEVSDREVIRSVTRSLGIELHPLQVQKNKEMALDWRGDCIVSLLTVFSTDWTVQEHIFWLMDCRRRLDPGGFVLFQANLGYPAEVLQFYRRIGKELIFEPNDRKMTNDVFVIEADDLPKKIEKSGWRPYDTPAFASTACGSQPASVLDEQRLYHCFYIAPRSKVLILGQAKTFGQMCTELRACEVNSICLDGTGSVQDRGQYPTARLRRGRRMPFEWTGRYLFVTTTAFQSDWSREEVLFWLKDCMRRISAAGQLVIAAGSDTPKHILDLYRKLDSRSDAAKQEIANTFVIEPSDWFQRTAEFGLDQSAFPYDDAQLLADDCKFEEAKQLIDAALNREPENAWLLQAAAEVSLMAGKAEAALRHSWKAVAVKPACAELHTSFGEALMKAGLDWLAEFELSTARTLEPSERRAEQLMVQLRLSRLLGTEPN